MAGDQKITAISKGKGIIYFDFPTGEEVVISRVGDNITSFSCSCGKKSCEHLAAAFFHLQKHLLTDLLPGKIRGKKVPNPFRENRSFFVQNRKLFEKKIINVLEFQRLIALRLKKSSDIFFIRLAMVSELSLVKEKEIAEMVRVNREKLERILEKIPSPEEVKAIEDASLVSVSTAGYFNTGIFSFLVPYGCLKTKDGSFLDSLESKLLKRKSKQQGISSLDPKEIALSTVVLGRERLAGKKPGPAVKSAEFYAALATFKLCAGQGLKASQSLREGYQKLVKKKPVNFTGYLEFAVDFASKTGNVNTELFFIRALLSAELFVNPVYFERINILLDKKGRQVFVDEVINKIKLEAGSFDKHFHLLLSQQRYDEALRLLDSNDGKFRYCAELMTRMLPNISEQAIIVYLKQFVSAIKDAPETHYQKRIFQNALTFLNQLPSHRRVEILQKMASELPAHSFLKQQAEELSAAILRA